MADKGKSSGSKDSGDVNYRSADTGRYVTERYAATHPKTTVRETDRPRSPSSPPGKGKK